MKYTYCFPTTIGDLTAVSENGSLLGLYYGREIKEAESHTGDTVLKETEKQVNEYLAGKRNCFELPLKLDGTPFQRQVWQALLSLPYGKTASYEEIAKAVEKPKASRAVGNAVGANPLLLIVPCHRIIKKSGETGNFGAGRELKKQLLRLEGQRDLK